MSNVWHPIDGMEPIHAAMQHLRDNGYSKEQISEFRKMRRLFEHAGSRQSQFNRAAKLADWIIEG